jgi:hypothetical protein
MQLPSFPVSLVIVGPAWRQGGSRMKSRSIPVDKQDSSAPGDASIPLIELKDRLGLPKWQDLSQELKELAVRHDAPWAEELKQRVDLHRKYVEYQTLLAINFSSLGLQYVNSLHNAMDLQNKLFELEEKLRKDGVNPLESEEWVKGRELLAKELQFIHKHGLDQKRFEVEKDRAKQRKDDDNIFTVEAEVDGQP